MSSIDKLKTRLTAHNIDSAETLIKEAMAWNDNVLNKTPLEYLKSKNMTGIPMKTPEEVEEAIADVEEIYRQIKSGKKKWVVPKTIFKHLIEKDLILPAMPNGKTQIAMEGTLPAYFVINTQKRMRPELQDLQEGIVYKTSTFDNVPEMKRYRFNDYVFIWAT